MHFFNFTGVDLPMKIVDMFGCGLPVLSIHFPAINELVTEKQNGYTFTTSQRLAAIIIQLLSGFPDECKVCSNLFACIHDATFRSCTQCAQISLIIRCVRGKTIGWRAHGH